MEYLWWVLIIIFFIVSFVGLVYPVIPSVVMIWGGVLLYFFFVEADDVGWLTWATLIILTGVLFITDFVANQYFVKRYGGSTWGMRAATIGLIIGCFVWPPFGILIIPFALVFLTEWYQNKDISFSLKVALGTLFAFLSGTFAKAIIQLVIIIVFFIDIFVL
ncbi:DUF456 domain-containing protein [Bacillus alkalicellulosilyticus]|uniref:DUF456 domain-containing protein n=1 Tax=Alkalihalobacterium alkalicellulosilyticum TaxID=1912214 RepID=UPI000997EF6F|nr:DUF456 family protein [Bacillus alkalicellulosilyticus]